MSLELMNHFTQTGILGSLATGYTGRTYSVGSQTFVKAHSFIAVLYYLQKKRIVIELPCVVTVNLIILILLVHHGQTSCPVEKQHFPVRQVVYDFALPA